MTRKQFIDKLRKFYRKEISNSKKRQAIMIREELIEGILDTALFQCYEINSGETEEKYFLEIELDNILNSYYDEYNNYLDIHYKAYNLKNIKIGGKKDEK